MTRNVQLVVLCEDTQHETFIGRFLERRDWNTRRIRWERGPAGRGSAEQFVRQRFPKELQGYRSRRNHVDQGLVVMLDGDAVGLEGRLRSLDESCRGCNVEPRRDDDRVAVFVPTWRIETWFAYLDGEERISETRRDYPGLDRPSDCRRHVDTLIQMCHAGAPREPAPPALRAACEEYRGRLSRQP